MTLGDFVIKLFKELTGILRAKIYAKDLKRKNTQGTT